MTTFSQSFEGFPSVLLQAVVDQFVRHAVVAVGWITTLNVVRPPDGFCFKLRGFRPASSNRLNVLTEEECKIRIIFPGYGEALESELHFPFP